MVKYLFLLAWRRWRQQRWVTLDAVAMEMSVLMVSGFNTPPGQALDAKWAASMLLARWEISDPVHLSPRKTREGTFMRPSIRSRATPTLQLIFHHVHISFFGCGTVNADADSTFQERSRYQDRTRTQATGWLILMEEAGYISFRQIRGSQCEEEQSSAAQKARHLVHTTRDGNNGGCPPGRKHRHMSLATAAERGRPMPKSPKMEAAGQCISPRLAGPGLVGPLEGTRGQPSTAITPK